MTNYLTHNENKVVSVQQAISEKLLSDCLCGTAACAIGHMPLLFPITAKRITSSYSIKFSLWDHLCKEVTGIGRGYLWSYLFGPHWARDRNYDSTSWAVADRIAYYLRTGRHDKERPYGESVRAGWISEEELEMKYKKFLFDYYGIN
jgi:hypothetical protein